MTPASQQGPRFPLKPWQAVALAVLVVLNGLAFWDFALLSRDLISGGRFADALLIRPVYHPTRLPPDAETKAHRAVRRIGADFAQVYFPAQHTSELGEAYDSSTTSSPWQMRSHYAPLVILACAATVCRLDYGLAVVIHHGLQVLLLYIAIYLALSHYGIRKWFVPTVLSINAFLFLTPVGLSWFERGQFAVYLGASYVFLVLGLLRRQPALLIAAAALAFIKWTSLPAIAPILGASVLAAASWREIKERILLAGVFAITFAALLLVPMLFTSGTDAFLRGLMTQESASWPRGISLSAYVARSTVMWLPLAVLLIGGGVGRLNGDPANWLVPFAAGTVGLMLTYPAQAYEYGLPSLIGFVPLLLGWARMPRAGRERAARSALSTAFAVFVAAASFSTQLLRSIHVLVAFYVAVSLILILGPALLGAWQGRARVIGGGTVSRGDAA